MTEFELLDKIDEFAQLEEGWDSYGARQITQDAIDAARSAIASVHPLPDWIVPTSSGGIQLEWHSQTRELEIEFHANGKPSILVVPKIGGVCLWNECIEWSPSVRDDNAKREHGRNANP